MAFPYLKDAFKSVDRTAVFSVSHQKSIPENLVNLLRTLYSYVSGGIGEHTATHEVRSKRPLVFDECPISPLLFDSVIHEELKSVLGLWDMDVKLI